MTTHLKPANHFEYMRKSVELDADTMQLIADHSNEVTLSQNMLFCRKAAPAIKFILLFQVRQDLTIQIFRAKQ